MIKRTKAVTLGRCLAVAAVVGLFAASGAQATMFINWDGNGGTGGDWATGVNWEGDVVPSNAVMADSVNVYIGANSSAASPATLSTAADAVQKLYVGEYYNTGGAPGYLELTTGADLEVKAHVGIGTDAGGTAVFTVSGGSFTSATSNNVDFTVGGSGAGTVNLTGGTTSLPRSIKINTNGTVVVADAAVFTSNQNIDTNDGGTLVLDGSKTGGGTDVTMTRGGDNRFHVSAGGTVKGIIDQDAADNAANMRKVVLENSDALFDVGSLLDLDFAAGVTPTAGSWVLLHVNGGGDDFLTDNGLAFAPGVDTGWSFTTDNNMLTVTYNPIPEPASMAMMALGGLMMWRRRFDRAHRRTAT